ncbi:MAG TPA: trypsin-like peptidase domain-containing protein [Chitinophagaceae bacterium]|nr:trypsin-like peptidase domain-containing protein [Chitinophagaceae bacterium]
MKKMSQILVPFFLAPAISISQTKEKWIDYPKDQWPIIALTNNVQFKNGDRYIDPSFKYAGTGFLIDNGKDTLAATAKHILWVAKNKKTKTVQVNTELSHWIMKSKGNNRDSAILDVLLNEDSTEILEGESSTITERDWIVFSVKTISSNIQPLKPRYTQINPGEKVYIPGCAYADSTCRVYGGVVLRKEGMDILIEHNMKEAFGGSSGSPVIDSNGYLIGIISSSTLDNKTGKDVLVAISTEYLYNLLNNKKGLNTPKIDYGKLILKTTLEKGTRQAISQFNRLSSDPANYYIYNIRSSNRNGLRETGEKLLELNRIRQAIKILKFNVKINSGYFVNYNLLAKAYLLAGNKNEAIKNYQESIKHFDSREENQAFKELERLEGNNNHPDN